MRIAFKEWAVVVDALGRGEQILILRKGGIHEGRGGFQVEHSRFWLFPTLFHQQRELVVPTAQLRFDQIATALPATDKLRLEYFAEVHSWRKLQFWEEVEALRGQHIWRDEVLRERFDWGRGKGIVALATRIHRLPTRIELPMLGGYGGCKSWVELDTDITANGARPVLTEAEFAAGLERFLGSAPANAKARCELAVS